MKRPRASESDELIVLKSFAQILSHVEDDARNKFTEKFGDFISNDICNELMWPEEQMTQILENDEIMFYFFNGALTSEKDIFAHFVGLANVDWQNNEISHICSRGYGRRIVEWIDEEFNHPGLWYVDALPQAVMFWHKLGFRLSNEKPKHWKLLASMARKYGAEMIGEWLDLDLPPDLNDYKGDEKYYDAIDVMRIGEKYISSSKKTYAMIREEPRKKTTGTLHQYFSPRTRKV